MALAIGCDHQSTAVEAFRDAWGQGGASARGLGASHEGRVEKGRVSRQGACTGKPWGKQGFVGAEVFFTAASSPTLSRLVPPLVLEPRLPRRWWAWLVQGGAGVPDLGVPTPGGMDQGRDEVSGPWRGSLDWIECACGVLWGRWN